MKEVLLILLLIIFLLPLPWSGYGVSFSGINFLYNLLVKGIRSFKIIPMNIKTSEDNLLTFDTIVKSVGIDYWLSEGTALGVVRDNGMIPWDDDVDTSFMYEYRDVFVREALPLLKQQGFYVGSVQCKGNLISLIRNGEKLDVDIVQKDGMCIAPMTPHANYSSKCNDILPYLNSMKTVIFLGRQFNVPDERYLEYLYGDWKTPQTENKMVLGVKLLTS
jgi:lipopolysaccharide cholinephosphotransferase